MRLLPPEPNVGDRITADLIRNLIRCIRERQILKGPNYSLQVTPNGTSLKFEVPSTPSSSAPVDHGCWKIVGVEREEEGENEGETITKSVRLFGNQFYVDGEHNLNELELTDAVEDFVCQGELDEGEEYTVDDRPFVCLKVPATTTSTEDPMLVGFAAIEELQAAQGNPAYVVTPLYKFKHDGAILIDFRNCPSLQVSEILP